MFSYYGSKSKIINYYPPPKFDKIIEPFAGSARYSLKYWDRDITLVDKYEVIIRIWKFLQNCTKEDINNLPTPGPGEDLRDYIINDPDALLLMRFLIKGGDFCPSWKVSSLGYGSDIPTKKRKICENLHKIKHWEIIHGCYESLESKRATWFIDPPYINGGHKYIESNKNIDYDLLAKWCTSREGQIIVCENTKADWLDFNPMVNMTGSMFTTTEAIWTNYPTSYKNNQLNAFDI